MFKNNREVVIVEGFRTPFVPSGQNFQNMPAEELGAWLIRELLERTEIALDEVEEVVLSNIVNSSGHSNIAYTIAVRAGLPHSIFATTVRRMDISSLESVFVSADKIRCGLADTLIAGGVESMSQAPILLESGLTKAIKKIIQSKTWKEKVKSVFSLRQSDIRFQFADKKLCINSLSGLNRRQIAEILSEIFYISREEQDAFVLVSCEKARRAQKEGRWKEEIVPVFPPGDFELIEKDKGLDSEPSMHYLSELPAYFKEDHGSVTVGNSSAYADGSAVLLMMSREKAKALGYRPLVSVHSFARDGAGFQLDNLGLARAVEKVLQPAGLKIKNIDLFEVDESFSVQALACLKTLGSFLFGKGCAKGGAGFGEMNPEKCNVNGGALALGNPLSATPVRMILNLAKEMRRRKVEWGLMAEGIHNEQAGALLLKNISD